MGIATLTVLSHSSIDSIVGYNAFGAKHLVVLSDMPKETPFLTQMHNNESHLSIPSDSNRATMCYAYSMSNNAYDQYLELVGVINKRIEAEVYGEGGKQLASITLDILSDTLPDFITFNSSIVDQMQWERVADVELTDGTSEVECSFYALINEFCCNAVLSPLLGAQFTESYQLLATDLASFNSKYWALALGLPRLSPIQGLPGAALAQKRLVQNLSKLLDELTSPPVRRVPDDDESVSGEETDADVLTPIAQLNTLFTKHELPMSVRAAVTLQVIHEIVADVVPLVFWTLIRIASSTDDQSPAPTEKIKQETKQWAQAYQPPSIHPSFPSPPALTYSSNANSIKADSFPYLRSCITEARRLYSTPSATYKITNPITIQEPSVRPNEHDTWELEAGSYINIGLSQILINSSPTIFPEPEIFKPERFLSNPITPSSITLPNDKTNNYKTSLIISIVTGIIQLWEISPAPKKTFFDHMQEAREEAQISAGAKKEKNDKQKKDATWAVPRAVEGSFVKVPRGSIRVRIRRREGLEERNVVRR